MQNKNLVSKFSIMTFISLAGLVTNGCSDYKTNESAKTSESTLNTNNSQTYPQAKNIILFIGDGMGVSTITAARIFDGQSQGMLGEEHYLAFEDFENLALIKTYNANAQVPDSAGTATAILSGYKANIGQVNIRPDMPRSDQCDSSLMAPTLSQIAAEAGKAVGIISTARITHATPAAMYSYSPSRDWEAEKDVSPDAAASGCTSIAAQLVAAETPINLALGGGRKEFSDEQVKAWVDQGSNHVTLSTASDLAKLNAQDGQDVLGLFTASHMTFEADRIRSNEDGGDEPSLADLTTFAIDNLSARGEGGYVLMVEAGRVDHAHHGSNAYRALRDMQALNEAVKVAKAKAGADTLIMVTADHSHVFTIAGYPKRGNPILGLVQPVDYVAEVMEGENASKYTLAEDGKPYTTLGYHNGSNVRLPDSPALTDNEVQAPDFRQQVAVPMGSETHAGEDVPLYATGPGADRVRGVMDQNEIHDVMVKAMGIKPSGE